MDGLKVGEPNGNTTLCYTTEPSSVPGFSISSLSKSVGKNSAKKMLKQKTSRNQGKGGDTQSAKILLEYVRKVRNELKMAVMPGK